MQSLPAAVSVRYPQVTTRLSKDASEAQLEVLADVTNWAAAGSASGASETDSSAGSVSAESGPAKQAPAGSVSGRLLVQIPGLNISCKSKQVTLAPGDSLQVVITSGDCPELLLPISDPAAVLWWPWQMGAANQHEMTTSFQTGADTISSVSSHLVGLRDASVSNDVNGNAVVRINGKRILVRGGG